MITKEQWKRLYKGILFVELEEMEQRANDPAYVGNPNVRMLYSELSMVSQTSRSYEELEQRTEVLLLSISRIIQSIEN